MKIMKSFSIFEKMNKSQIKRQEFEGYEIIFGKSAEANEEVTFILSEPNDIWLHARGVPGSHVIIKTKDTEPKQSIIEFAAKLAAKHSKSKTNTQTVVYTKAKYVSKESGMSTGQVSVKNGTIIEVDKTIL